MMVAIILTLFSFYACGFVLVGKIIIKIIIVITIIIIIFVIIVIIIMIFNV